MKIMDQFDEFINFAEAIAEARGKAQADSLRKTREETPAKLIRCV